DGAHNNFLNGGAGNDVFVGSGVGPNVLVGGPGLKTFFGDAGINTIIGLKPGDRNFLGSPIPHSFFDDFLGLPPSPTLTLTAGEVNTLLARATAATPSTDGIVAIVDRGGRILGIRVEDGV